VIPVPASEVTVSLTDGRDGDTGNTVMEINLQDISSCSVSNANNTTHATCDFNNTPFTSPVVGDVSTNDQDYESDGFSSFTLVGTNGGVPTNEGTVVLNNDGTYTFTPDSSFSGETSFTYEVCDDGTPMACDIAEVFIEVFEQVNPEGSMVIANFDAHNIESGMTGSGDLLANDFDPDDRFLAVTTTMVDMIVAGVDEDGNTVTNAGLLTINTNGTYSFIPASGFIGKVTQPYTISTSMTPGQTDNSILEITVIENTGNSTFAHDDARVTDKGITINHTVLQNDSDDEGNAQAVTSFTRRNKCFRSLCG